MKETDRIVSLFEKLYNGEPWIDVTIQGTLSRISAAQAFNRPIPNCNTIWEIVNHLIEWKINVLQRINGQVLVTPANNYISPILDPSDLAWDQTLNRFESVHNQWLEYLRKVNTGDFDSHYPPNQMTYYEHILGILQHEAYHLGQIVILAKQV
ncbi:MAG TPA: DinB family protein [Algoriphagus sp.]|nr:DinB family protein [Algoriphagus sp.]